MGRGCSSSREGREEGRRSQPRARSTHPTPPPSDTHTRKHACSPPACATSTTSACWTLQQQRCSRVRLVRTRGTRLREPPSPNTSCPPYPTYPTTACCRHRPAGRALLPGLGPRHQRGVVDARPGRALWYPARCACVGGWGRERGGGERGLVGSGDARTRMRRCCARPASPCSRATWLLHSQPRGPHRGQHLRFDPGLHPGGAGPAGRHRHLCLPPLPRRPPRRLPPRPRLPPRVGGPRLRRGHRRGAAGGRGAACTARMGAPARCRHARRPPLPPPANQPTGFGPSATLSSHMHTCSSPPIPSAHTHIHAVRAGAGRLRRPRRVQQHPWALEVRMPPDVPGRWAHLRC